MPAVVLNPASVNNALLAIPGTNPFNDVVVVKLVKSPFVATPATDYESLTLADFNGSTPLTSSAEATLFYDPVKGRYIYRWPDPEGGWNWATGLTTNLPQTIYGAVLFNDVDPFASFNITPVPLTAGGQLVQIDDIIVEVAPNPLG